MNDRNDREGTGLEIAVIGMAGRFPGARSVDQLWENLKEGVESITFFTEEELAAAGVERSVVGARSYVRAAGVLDDVDRFDASFFGYSPREASRMDPQHRIFLETAWAALEDAAIVPATFGRPIGIYAGSGMNTYLVHHVVASGSRGPAAELDHPTVIGNDKDFLTTRVSYKLDLEGPSVVVQTACSTSLVAIHLACQALISADCDVALAGGVTIRLPQIAGYMFQDEGVHSPDGHCRAFDRGAQGSVPGSGAAIVVLKRLADALADGDAIHAVVKGTAINNDGASKVGYSAPRVDGQAQVIRAALNVAGTPAETIGYVEAHGTGTILGDPIEVEALTAAFRHQTKRRSFCGIGSIKTNLGHLDAAAGVSAFIKAVLCVKHGLIPPSLHFRDPNPRIDFESTPFFVERALRKWRTDGRPRRAGVSSFGIGGTNAHAIVEEPPPTASRRVEPSSRSHLFLLSAKSEPALERMRQRLVDHIERNPGISLDSVAHTLTKGRTRFAFRASFAAASEPDALAALRRPSPRSLAEADARLGFLFPGQGSQYQNMGRGLYEDEPVFRRFLDEGSALLSQKLGFELRRELYPADTSPEAASRLDETEIAQPAIFLVSYALARLWESVGVRPAAMLGHSIGEYVAACLADVISFPDALTLVAERGRLMATAPPGAMLVVAQDPAEIASELGQGLELASVNAPRLAVVSGAKEAITRLEQVLTAREIEHRRLRTSHGFHSSSMDPVLQAFKDVAGKVELGEPRIPYISNVTGTWITPEQARDPGYWASHLRSTVLFSEGVQELSRKVSAFLEVGPGRGLTALVRRQGEAGSKRAAFASTRHRDETRPDRSVWLECLGDLWSHGVDIRQEREDPDFDSPSIPLPTYPFERDRHWIEPDPRPASPAASPRLPWDQWFSAPSWQRLLTPQRRAGERLESAGSWIVFEDPHGLGAAFADRLERDAQLVFRVLLGEGAFEQIDERHFSIAPGDAEAYRLLVRRFEASHGAPSRIVHFWNVEPDGEARSGLEHLAVHQRRSFESVLYLVQALGGSGAVASFRLTVVTTQVQRVLGNETLCPEKAMAIGPVRVAPLEYPGCRATAIDILYPAPESAERERLLELLLTTALEPDAPPIVAVRGDERWFERFVPVPIDLTAPPPMEREGVYLITGGTGGIGLALAEHLARTCRAKLILTGTTRLPERERWEEEAARGDESELRDLLEPVTALDEEIATSSTRKPMSAYEGLERSLDALCAAHALRLFGSVMDLSHSDRLEIAELKRRLALIEEMEPYLEMLIRSVCEEGFAERESDCLHVVTPRKEWPDPENIARDLGERYAEFLPIVKLLVHCFSQLGAVLRGERPAISVLYGDGREIFRAGVENALAHSHAAAYHALVRELVSGILRTRATNRRPLRILEVGAGEGILTEQLIPVLDGGNVEYYFTDIGKSFVVQAEKKAGERGIGWMRFGRLDIARSPIPQGFGAGAFDLVLAFNVVHATRRLRETLRHLAELLVPGGLLVIQESVRRHRWVDCVWGLTEGWWLFQDREIRASSPLVDLDTWERLLEGAGLETVASYPRAREARARVDSGVLLAQKPAASDDGPGSEATPRSRIRKILAIESLGSPVEVACADVADRTRMAEVIRDAEARFGRIDGVVHAALVLDDGAMQLKTREIAEKVLAPKVRGTLVLKELFEGQDLEFFAIFSSLVSVLGGSGQVDYCAASSFQDAFAHQQKGKLARTVVAIDWAAWRQVGKAMRSALARGIPADEVLPEGMSTGEGLEAFDAVLASSLPQVLVSPRPLDASRFSPLVVGGDGPRGAVSARTEAVTVSDEPSPDMPRTEAERKVAAIWRELLGLASIGIHDNFFELGADSVVSLQFIARAKQEGYRFTNAQVFELQTIARLLNAEGSDQEEP